MKKYLTILILFFSFTASAQIVYTPMSAGGYQMKYLKIDSGFALPFRDTTIGRGINRPGLLVVNTQDSVLYIFNGKKWTPAYVDSTGVIGLIKNKVDSVTLSGNNLFYWSNGTGYGSQLNKLDSIYMSNDSVYTCIAGNCTFRYINSGIDSLAYHSLIVNSDSTQGKLINLKGDTTRFEIWADGLVGTGVQSVTGTAVDNTDPKNPVINSSTLPYKVYTAILQDTGASAHAPIPVVLENTLGCTVSISYSGVGWYTVTLSSPLMTNSTIVICQNPGYSPMTLLEYDPSDASNFTLHVRRTDGTPVDGQCNGAFLEIRIY